MSAIIVTRGNVRLDPIWESLPEEWEYITWDNGKREVSRSRAAHGIWETMVANVSDLSVYGRFAAIEHASHDLVYVQDDDVIVSDPQEIADTWQREWESKYDFTDPDHRVPDADADHHLVANMPQEFRHDGYTDSCLIGFGACFHRDAPQRAFDRWHAATDIAPNWPNRFNRTCDVVFTTLTPRVFVDVPKESLAYAWGEDRMWRQPDHFGERTQVLELARKVRDA